MSRLMTSLWISLAKISDKTNFIYSQQFIAVFKHHQRPKNISPKARCNSSCLLHFCCSYIADLLMITNGDEVKPSCFGVISQPY